MTRTSRLAVLMLGVAVALSFAPKSASACSCMEMTDPGQMLDDAGGAFVGTMVHKEGAAGDEFSAIYHFEVEQWVKAELGPTAEVVSGMNSAGCGWEQPTGDRMGVLVYFDGQALTSGLCSTMDPVTLVELGKSHVPGPTASPPIHPQDLGLDPPEVQTGSATTVARVSFGVLALAALAGAGTHLVRRRRSVEEE